jgi:sigma54-dependent transcription regulator
VLDAKRGTKRWSTWRHPVFDRPRSRRSSTNDADRLDTYLARFGRVTSAAVATTADRALATSPEKEEDDAPS